MMAERAEQGTNITSSEPTTRSLPRLRAAIAEIAGTLHPSPIRNGTATSPCSPSR